MQRHGSQHGCTAEGEATRKASTGLHGGWMETSQRRKRKNGGVPDAKEHRNDTLGLLQNATDKKKRQKTTNEVP
jgi:hypothetical protein